MSARSTRQILKNLAFSVGGTLPLLALTILGWGDCRSFFAHPARLGIIVLALAGAIAYGFSGSSGLECGQSEDPSSRWIFVPLVLIALAFAWLPPRFDHVDLGTIDGDAARYSGLLLTAIGGYIRVRTVFELGHRFNIFVARQENHALCETGSYRFVRHPSYSGALLVMIGWALVFRSAIGLLLIGLTIFPIVFRIQAEEDFLVREFGEQYRAYQRRTRWRLLPFVY